MHSTCADLISSARELLRLGKGAGRGPSQVHRPLSATLVLRRADMPAKRRNRMRYEELGTSGITVSKLCVGCMSFGKASGEFHKWTLGPDDTRVTVERALNLGVNFFDTANCYAQGTSEEYLGSALRDLGIDRSKVVIASKVYFNPGRLSREAINREIDGTLRRLGPTTSTCTSSTVSTMTPRLRRRWKRSTHSSPQERYVPSGPPPCTGTSSITCRSRPIPTAGPDSPHWRTTTTCCTAKTNTS